MRIIAVETWSLSRNCVTLQQGGDHEKETDGIVLTRSWDASNNKEDNNATTRLILLCSWREW